jgi:membrane protein DedA with SNARE-associated domain
MFPAMLPPPTPFKIFILGAAVFEMPFRDFVAAMFAGRFVRFFILALLVLFFGPQIVGLLGDIFRRHLSWVVGAIAGGVLVWLIMRRGRSRRRTA